MINHKIIQDEAIELRNQITSGNVVIPEFWSCAWPGLFFMAWIVLLPLSTYSIFGLLSEDVIFCSAFSLVFGLIIFSMIFNVMGAYLSVSKSFRDNSKIVNMLKVKVRNYAFVFFSLNTVELFLSISTGVGPLGYYVPTVFTFVLFGLVFSSDISRYRLSAFTSVLELLKSRKQGGE